MPPLAYVANFSFSFSDLNTFQADVSSNVLHANLFIIKMKNQYVQVKRKQELNVQAVIEDDI